jgi:hypothetical protein
LEKKRRKNNQVRNLENFKSNAEVLAVHSRELSLFGIAGFSSSRSCPLFGAGTIVALKIMGKAMFSSLKNTG